jgi:copper chaperone CopZ
MACGTGCCGSNNASAISTTHTHGTSYDAGHNYDTPGPQISVASTSEHRDGMSGPITENSDILTFESTRAISVGSSSRTPQTLSLTDTTGKVESIGGFDDDIVDSNREQSHCTIGLSPPDTSIISSSCCEPGERKKNMASHERPTNTQSISSGCSSQEPPLDLYATRRLETTRTTSCSEQDVRLGEVLPRLWVTSKSCCVNGSCSSEGSKVEKDCYNPKRLECVDSCCRERSNDASTSSPCEGGKRSNECCTNSKKEIPIDTVEVRSCAVDVEKGSDDKEHVVLSISGMTCTGCETKLKRTLGTLSYVSNLKTSLILARAELDILDGSATADDVVKHLQRTTEFLCERIQDQGTSLDLICQSDPTATINSDWPSGVLEVTKTGKQTIRVAFDAKVIGARELLAHEWATSFLLAPPRTDPSLEAGGKYVRTIGLLTLLSALLTVPVLVLAWAPLPERKIAYGSASLALATTVQVVIAGPFYPKAMK